MLATDECFMTVYGTLRRHPWIGNDGSDTKNGHELIDAYGEEMNWGRTGGDLSTAPYLWVLHDAGWDWSDNARTQDSHLLWAHTSLTPLAKKAVLPILQLGLCLEQSLRRVGHLKLAGMQILLPTTESAKNSSQDVSHLSATSDPERRYEMDIEIDGGEDGKYILRAPEIFSSLNEVCNGSGVRIEQTHVSQSPTYLLEEPAEITRVGWLGAGKERLIMRLSVPEISVGISCYILAQIVRSAYTAGVTSPLLITILRHDERSGQFRK